MAPDLDHAREFLTALDPRAESWTLQTFDDDDAKRKRLTRLLHGTLDQHVDTLSKLNADGAGIFVAVNQTDGTGRRKDNITRIRALFVDLDGAPIEPAMAAATPAHIVVESSPERYHAYWRVTDCTPDACEPALKEMIRRFDGDPACSDRSRVLRLPGFVHQKREPFMVRVVGTAPGEYRLSDLGIATPTEEYRGVLKSSSVSSVSSVGGDLIRFLPDSPGQRNTRLFDLARYLKGTNPNATKQEQRSVVEEWHRLARPVIGTAEFSESWGDFVRGWESVRMPYGSVLNPILEKVDMAASEIPESLVALGYGEKAYRLICICKELQQSAGDEPFFLSARIAGESIGCHFTDASSMMVAFVADGVLDLVKRGAGNVASRYRYVWPAACGDDDAYPRPSDGG